MKILVTGGAGYIGSHTVRALLAQGHEVIVLDNLSRGHRGAVPAAVRLVVDDIHHIDAVRNLLQQEQIEAAVHFAAHSQVGESMENPTIYYDNNTVGSYCLLEAVRQAGVKYFVFSSTAAVYGEPAAVPITEDMPYAPTNVYGETKLMIERMLAQFSRAYGLRYVALLGTARQRVTTRGELRLIAQLLPDLQRRAITHKGRDWPAPLVVWDEAFEEVFSARDSGALELPLTSHGYLYAVIQRLSDRAEAKAEAKAEHNKRVAPVRGNVQVRGGAMAIGDAIGAALGGKDATLAALDERDKQAAPMPESVRAKLAEIKKGTTA